MEMIKWNKEKKNTTTTKQTEKTQVQCSMEKEIDDQ